MKIADFAGLTEAIEAWCPEIKPKSVVAGAAGTIEGRRTALTNAHWVIEGAELVKRLGLSQGYLVNDFEAEALALPVLKQSQVHRIGQVPKDRGTRVVLGPGTGLGVGALIERDGHFSALPTCAGQLEFGPVGPDEEEFWPRVERVEGRICVETLISGRGLARLHKARTGEVLDEAGLVTAALADPKSPAADTARAFWKLVARFAGDMALIYVARGGVTLTGGILPRILPLLDEAAFRAAFEAKQPMQSVPQNIATELVIDSTNVLDGLAAFADRPEVYDVDSDRLWVL